MSATVAPIFHGEENVTKTEEEEKSPRKMRTSNPLRKKRQARQESFINGDLNPRATKRVFLDRLKSLAIQEDKQEWIVFNPSDPRRISWDGLIIVCLLYVFIVTPLEVTYGEPSSEGWKHMGRLVDVIFWVDIVICFRTAYIQKDGELVTDSWKMAKHYMKDFFIIDLMSCLPGFPLSDIFESLYSDDSDGGDTGANFVKLDDLRDSFSELVVGLKLLRLLCVTSFWLHLNACAFSLVSQQHSDARDNWVGVNGPFKSWSEEYINALYWSTSTSTTVGYGDVSAQTESEKLFSVVSMAIGVGLYGYIIGSMTDLVSSTSFVESRVQQRMDEVFCFLKKHGFSTELRRSLLKFYRNHFKTRKLIDEKAILQHLPSKLMQQVKESMILDGMKMLAFFQNIDMKYFPRVINLLEPMTFQGGEVIIEAKEAEHHSEFYILTDGRVTIYRCRELDKHITRQEREEELILHFETIIVEILTQYDTDNDGFIDKEEMRFLIRDLYNMADVPDDKVINKLMGKLSDINITQESQDRVSIPTFVHWYVKNRILKDNKTNEHGDVVGRLNPTCVFGTWTAFDLGRGSLSPYSYIVNDESIVDVCSLCARELLDEFHNDEDALNVIFETLVAPAMEIGMEIDLHPTHSKMTPHRQKKLLKISRNFSSRVMSKDGKPKEVKTTKSKRHFKKHLSKLDEGSSVMLALQKDSKVRRKSNPRHPGRKIFKSSKEEEDDHNNSTSEDSDDLESSEDRRVLRVLRKVSEESDAKHKSLSGEIGELKEQVKVLTELLMGKTQKNGTMKRQDTACSSHDL